jgi:hypothetical protein
MLKAVLYNILQLLTRFSFLLPDLNIVQVMFIANS